jgi:hypothetical protein
MKGLFQLVKPLTMALCSMEALLKIYLGAPSKRMKEATRSFLVMDWHPLSVRTMINQTV